MLATKGTSAANEILRYMQELQAASYTPNASLLDRCAEAAGHEALTNGAERPGVSTIDPARYE